MKRYLKIGLICIIFFVFMFCLAACAEPQPEENGEIESEAPQEELQLRVFFTNKEEIEFTNIYVNGKKVNVVGGDRIETAIIKFVPETSGLIDFYVDRVDYTFGGTEINQKITSDKCVTYPIYGDLDFKYEFISSSPYEYTGGGIYCTFDNSEDYVIYSVSGGNYSYENYELDFEMLDNDSFIIKEGVPSSVTYGYEHYGKTTQTISLYVPVGHKVYGYKAISTPEEFLAMSDGYYYLTDDIDLSQYTVKETLPFSGILYGNGHKVKNLTCVIDTSKEDCFNIYSGNNWNYWDNYYYSAAVYDVKFTSVYVSIDNSKGVNGSVDVSPFGDIRFYNSSVSGDYNYKGSVYFNGINIMNDSSTLKINVLNEGITYQMGSQASNTVEKSDKITFADGFIYFNCDDGKRMMVGCFDNTVTELHISKDDGICYVADNTFGCCSNIKKLVIDEEVKIKSNLGLYNNTFTYVDIPVGILANCGDSFKQVETAILKGKGQIPGSAFYGNDKLVSLTLGEGITDIGESAFNNCSSLTEVIIPEGVTSIGSEAFSGCNKLANITIPEGVISIGSYAFGGCSQLTEMVIPEGVISIGSEAFSGCNKLANITIPEGVISIGSYAFGGCHNITKLTIPSTVKEIGDGAFYCSNLTEVHFGGTIADWCDINFKGWASNPLQYGHNLYIDDKLVTEIIIPDTVTEIGNNQFRGWNGTKIFIPDSVETIGEEAFGGCYNLTIYASASDLPAGWNSYWNNSDSSVIWDVKEVYGQLIVYNNNRVYSMVSGVYLEYSDCIHTTGTDLWTYDENGKPCTEITVKDWETVTEATCEVAGEKQGVCTGCQEIISAPIPAKGHSFDANGYCENCGANIPYEVINDNSYPFAEEDGVIYSTNKMHNSSSSYSLVANGHIIISFEYNVSSESGCDRLIIQKGDITLVEASGTENIFVPYEVNLASGETVTFIYSKDGSVNSGDDCCYIRNISVNFVEEN